MVRLLFRSMTVIEKPSLKKRILLFLVLLLMATPQANATGGYLVKPFSELSEYLVKKISEFGEYFARTFKITKLSKSKKVLSDDEIIRLSKISDEANGSVKIGKELSKLGLPNDVLEDTFMRIAIYQRKFTRIEAEGMFSRLSGTPGFSTTLRKIIGNNAVGSVGHLNELKIADTASMHRFSVLKIGEPFDDGLKKAPTDIDIILRKVEKYYAIEAKDYASTTPIPMDMFRADLDTLVMYRQKNPKKNIIPILAITNKPDDLRYLILLKHETKKRGVQLVIGSPQGVIEQVKLL